MSDRTGSEDADGRPEQRESAYDRALIGQGPDEQCPTLIEPYRCILNRRHVSECESYGLDADGSEVQILLGVAPVRRSS